MATRRRHTLRCCATLALAAAACRSPRPTPVPERRGVATAFVSASAEPRAAPPLGSVETQSLAAPPALLEPTPLVTLAVPGFRDAVVSVPLGAREPRLVALALHGNFDRPEWQCEVWRRITQGEVFVLCPRGIPRTDVPKELDRWEWGSLAKTRAELVAALGALRSRYPEHVRPGPWVFTGFSLGAILGARLIQDPELEVGAAVLIEGGYQGWTSAKAARLEPRLKRLLFACGQTECRNAYRYELEGLLRRAGVAASMVADVHAGHTYDDPVAPLIGAEWSRLTQAILEQ
jgi:dienelactone hydrolase